MMQERVLGTIERLGLRRANFLQENPQYNFGGMFDELKVQPIDRSFIDQGELEAETAYLSSALEQAFRLRSETRIEVSSRAEAARWDTVQKRINDLIDIGSTQNKVLTEFETGNPSGRSNVEAAMSHCSHLGTELSLRNALREQLALAHKAGVEDMFIDYTELVDFSSGFITAAKIDGVSLEDFTDPRIAKRSPVPFFQFLAIAQSLAYRKIHENVLRENQDTIASQFPNHSKWNLGVLSTRVSFLMVLTQPEVLREVSKHAPKPLDEVYRNTQKILEGVTVVREKARKVLLNPNDPDSAAIRQITDIFLKSPLVNERIHILHILGLNRFSTLYGTYRQAYQLMSGDGGEFYFDLAMEIHRYIEDIASVKDILNIEDIDSFLLEDGPGASLEDQAQLQAKHINELTSLTSQRFFEINPATVELGNLAVPQLIEVSFDKNRPRKFTVNLVYNNELYEEVEIEYTLDTTKGKETFDWNFLEDPMHPESYKVTVMRDQLALLASALLIEITTQEAQKRQPIKIDQASIEGKTTAVKRERFDDPIYALRRKVREEQRAEKAQQTNEIDVIPALQKGAIKNIILMDESIKEKIHLGSVDEQMAIESIREYNERGVGEFTRKRKRGPDGKPRYTLRSGNARILVREDAASNGKRNFEIIDIRDRKNIYPENKL